MCTLTVRRHDQSLLVTMNRDEQKTRPIEKPPFHWVLDDIYAPQDSKRSGTWAGMNRYGQVACLLNGYLQKDKTEFVKSRGELIPMVLSNDNPNEASRNINADQYASFDLFVMDHSTLHHHAWNGQDFTHHEMENQEWFFFTSSSWHQDEVKNARFEAYEKWLHDNAPLKNNLPIIHIEEDLGSSAHAVLMDRVDACTKSITQFDCRADSQIVRYWPKPHENIQKYEELSVI